jgi:cytolysin (calcineurin-like family phosphatase)
MTSAKLRRRLIALALLVLCASRCSSITVPDKAPTVGETFSMIVAADPQYPWWNAQPCHACSPTNCTATCDAAVCAGTKDAVTECEKRNGAASIRDQIAAASKITILAWPSSMGGGKIAAPIGLVVNGDLTAFFHYWQVREVDQLVGDELEKIRKSDAGNPILKIIPFLGLGNHDYRNNVCDCRSHGPFDLNSCARVAAHLMYKLYDNKYPWIRFNPCSLGYSWTLGKIRFVQMHLWPGYTADFGYWRDDGAACLAEPKRFSPDARKCDDGVVFPSWAFLDSELTAADVNGQRSVLLFHDPAEYWTSADVAKFKEIVARHDVIAVFAGHYHGEWGVRTNYEIANNLKNRTNGTVPVILSGASENRKFVVAEFTSSSMKAAVISAAGGTPSFQATTNESPTPQYQTSW